MASVKIVMYRFTGWQGFFKVPEKWCPECDLVVRATYCAMAQSKHHVDFVVRPWFLWFWRPLLQFGSWHAPILVVGKHLVSAGKVPDDDKVLCAIEEAAR